MCAVTGHFCSNIQVIGLKMVLKHTHTQRNNIDQYRYDFGFICENRSVFILYSFIVCRTYIGDIVCKV